MRYAKQAGFGFFPDKQIGNAGCWYDLADHFDINGLDDTSEMDLIIEAAFENADRRLADLSGHLCPDTLVAELSKFEHREVEIWTMHQKPGTNAEIRSELERLGNLLKCAIPRDLIRDTTLVF